MESFFQISESFFELVTICIAAIRFRHARWGRICADSTRSILICRQIQVMSLFFQDRTENQRRRKRSGRAQKGEPKGANILEMLQSATLRVQVKSYETFLVI